MDPVKDEYQPLDVKTFTSLNSDGFVFVIEKTFVPPMMMQQIILPKSSSWPTSMLIHSLVEGSHLLLIHLGQLYFPLTADEMRNPREGCVQMAGVRSPYLDPRPAPLPPVVIWSICRRPDPKVLALNSKDTFHCAIRMGIVVTSWFFFICRSDAREYASVQVPG